MAEFAAGGFIPADHDRSDVIPALLDEGYVIPARFVRKYSQAFIERLNEAGGDGSDGRRG